MVNLRKEAKINLVKGQRICLTKTAEKSGEKINFAFLGANWSSLKDGSSVDLDLSVLVYDKNKKLIWIFFIYSKYSLVIKLLDSIRFFKSDRDFFMLSTGNRSSLDSLISSLVTNKSYQSLFNTFN